MLERASFRKRPVWDAALLCILLAAAAIVSYAQTSGRQRAHSANLQVAMSAGYLGLGVQDLSAEEAKALNLKAAVGLEVSSVVPDSPASRAGIHVHDVILEVDGQKVGSQDQFAESIGGKAPGTKVALTISHNGANRNVTAILEARPVDFFMGGPGAIYPAIPIGPISPEDLEAMVAANTPKVGFEGESLTPQLADFFGVHEGEGVLVRSVTQKTPAEKAGLRAGDVVIKVNGMPVGSPREISGFVREKKTVIFTVIRNKKQVTLNIEMASIRLPPENSEFN